MTPPVAMQIETEIPSVTTTGPARETRTGRQVGMQNATARMPRPVRTANIFTPTATGKRAVFATDSWPLARTGARRRPGPTSAGCQPSPFRGADSAESTRHLQTTVVLRPNDPNTLYNAGCAYGVV